MTRTSIYHALGLHMHQPPGNLRRLIEADPWVAEQIIRCYERPVRYAEEYRDVARIHVGFSGVLLEQFLDPDIVDRYRQLLDIPQMLARYAEAENVELMGMGYYHPIFPLIPRKDWAEQLDLGREITERAFGRAPRGFWPPELAFKMEMIPYLVAAGYDYVVVDGVHVRPEDGISDVFRPYLACHDGVCISIVPRDREVSDAQESGLDPNWFNDEVCWRVGGSARPDENRLVTTWSDGENGDWFRRIQEKSGFFGHFFSSYMDRVRGGEYPVTPVSLNDYLEKNPAHAQAQVQTGSWNIGGTAAINLSQWGGTASQRAAVDEVRRLSARYWELRGRVDLERPDDRFMHQDLDRARRSILEAQTSCFLCWGDAWIPYLYERTGPAQQTLDEIQSFLDITRERTAPQPSDAEAGDPLHPVAADAAVDLPADGCPDGCEPPVRQQTAYRAGRGARSALGGTGARALIGTQWAYPATVRKERNRKVVGAPGTGIKSAPTRGGPKKAGPRPGSPPRPGSRRGPRR